LIGGIKMGKLTQAQIAKKYKNTYVEVLDSYCYDTRQYLYEVVKTSKTTRENMTLGQDLGTDLEYTR